MKGLVLDVERYKKRVMPRQGEPLYKNMSKRLARIHEYDAFLTAKELEPNVDSLSLWIDTLLDTLSPGSIQVYFYYVLSYFEVMLLPLDPMKLKNLKKWMPKQKVNVANYLTREEIRKLFQCDMKPEIRLIYTLCYEYARRLGEVIKNESSPGVQWKDIDFKKNKITFHILKKDNATEATFPLSDSVAQELLEFKKGEEGPVFNLMERSVELAFKKHCAAAGIHQDNEEQKNRRLVPHILRHSKITHLRQDKVPLDYVSKRVAQHSRVDTTIQFYRGFSEQEDEELDNIFNYRE